jgi:hypothetical protein
MQFNHDKLRGRITEKFGSQAAFASHINWAESALSNRLNNKVPLSDDEIYLFCLPKNLDIQPEEIPAYFFTL